MPKGIIEKVTARGTMRVEKGKCVICNGPVIEIVSLAPCGQQVRPVDYYCNECKLSGSNHLWEDAWVARAMLDFKPTAKALSLPNLR